jgi:hypothetical protein
MVGYGIISLSNAREEKPMKEVKGKDECFACGAILNWEYIPSPRKGQVITYMKPDVRADITAIGKEDDKIKIEAVCTCISCGMRNKYIKLV